MTQFADLLVRQMDNRGLTAEQLAPLVGRASATIYRWLASDVVPDPGMAHVIAEAIGLPESKVSAALLADATEKVRAKGRYSRAELERRISELERKIGEEPPERK